MPETAVDEQDFSAAGEHQVRLPWQTGGTVASVQPEPISGGVQKAADQKLRFCVLAPDAGHVSAALLGSEDVGHGPSLGKGHDWVSRYPDWLEGISKAIRSLTIEVTDKPLQGGK